MNAKNKNITRTINQIESLASGWKAFAIGCRNMAQKEETSGDSNMAVQLRIKADTLDNAACELKHRLTTLEDLIASVLSKVRCCPLCGCDSDLISIRGDESKLDHIELTVQCNCG